MGLPPYRLPDAERCFYIIWREELQVMITGTHCLEISLLREAILLSNSNCTHGKLNLIIPNAISATL